MLIKLYYVSLPIFLVVDMIWLGLISKNFYAEQIGFLMKTNVNWLSAAIFYLLFILGLDFFVIYPAVEKNSWVNALALGALFGLVTYSTYDLTNLATIKGWPLSVTITDLLWGTFVSAFVSLSTYLIYIKFKL